MNDLRISHVAEALVAIGYDGIAAFDAHEPEFRAFSETVLDVGTEPYAALLGIIAGSQDFQLAGDAQLFWEELERTVERHGRLENLDDVKSIMDAFMDRPVNARLNNMKRGRLDTLYDSGFPEWFLRNYGAVQPLEVWERLADGLNNPMRRKTVVLAMKIYDLVHLIAHNDYLELPEDIPIPCDLQVERVAHTSGIIDHDDAKGADIMDAWASVASRVSEQLGRPVSLLRLDSVVWQAGQHIGEHEPNGEAARRALGKHFEDVGLDPAANRRLAEEFTVALSNGEEPATDQRSPSRNESEAVDLLQRIPREFAAVIPDVDAVAEHDRWKPGLGPFEEENQLEMIVDAVVQRERLPTSIEREVPYPGTGKRCDLLFGKDGLQLPVEAKLLRFRLDNGNIDPNMYKSVFSPFPERSSSSLLTDAAKLAESDLGESAGLLGIYYEREDEPYRQLRADRIAEKFSQDVGFWYGMDIETLAIEPFEGLRHPHHQQGAIITWLLSA